MEVRNGKLCLPTTYDSFLAIRKKNTKPANIIKALLSFEHDIGGKKVEETFRDENINVQKDPDSDEEFVDKNVV